VQTRPGCGPELAEAAFHLDPVDRCWGSEVYSASARAAYGGWREVRGRLADAEPHPQAARESYAERGATAWLEELEHARVRSGA
jgi:hypothetical protein